MFGVVLALSAAFTPADSSRSDSLHVIEVQASSALGFGQKASDLGSGVRVEARVLRQLQSVNPNELAATVPGLIARDEDGFGLRINWGIRGTGTERSNRIVLMEDGVLTAPAAYSSPAAYYQPSLMRMAGMDVAKGSSQIAAGPQTTGGAINFSSNATDVYQRLKFRTALGSYGTYFAHSLVSVGGTKKSASLEWLRQHSNGFRQMDGGGRTGFDFNELVFKSQFRMNSRNTLLFKAMGKMEDSPQSYVGLTEADFAENPYRQYALAQKDRFTTQFGQAWVRHLWTGRRSSVSTTAYAQYFGRNWYKLEAITEPGGTRTSLASALANPSLERYRMLTLAPEAMGTAELRWNNRHFGARGVQTHGRHELSGQNEVRFGARWHQDFADRLQNNEVFDLTHGTMTLLSSESPGSAGNERSATAAASGYVEGSFRSGAWTWVPGLRIESIWAQSQKWGGSDSLRAADPSTAHARTTVALPGLRVQRERTNHVLFASVHRGFAAAPTNPEVKAEQSVNGELGVQMGRGRQRWTATAFATYYQNMLGSDMAAAGGSGTGDLFNAGAARVLGLEGSGQIDHKLGAVRLNHIAQGSFMYSAFTKTFKASTDVWRDVAVGDPIPYTPMLQGNLRSEARWGKWGCVANIQYVGRSESGRGLDLAPRTLVHGGIFVEPAKKWRIQLDGSNLTGSTAVASLHPAGWRVIGPRMLRLGVSYGW
ncbi:MAG: hypothetical protein RIR61_87 [Bacteroidota bacterium]|jgi:Fe(3+) dicitrate transport protein